MVSKEDQKSFQEITEEITGLANVVNSQTADSIKKIQEKLTANEKRLLEYFWNKKRKEVRAFMPEDIIVFFETEAYNADLHMMQRNEVRRIVVSLMGKGYVERESFSDILSAKNIDYKLTAKGHVYLKDQHPNWVTFIEQLIQRTPRIITFLIGLIGLVSSIFGIIQFFSDLHK